MSILTKIQGEKENRQVLGFEYKYRIKGINVVLEESRNVWNNNSDTSKNLHLTIRDGILVFIEYLKSC